jgi:HipA-like protein
MKQGKVFNNSTMAGIISKSENGVYTFKYNSDYVANINLRAISISFPKQNKIFESKVLFPFFFSLLSEGSNKKLQSKLLKIDEDDYFEFLLKTTNHETIGAIKVEEVINE